MKAGNVIKNKNGGERKDQGGRKGSRLLIPPTKSVNFGTNSITFRGSLLWNNLPLRLKYNQTTDDFKI